MEMEASNSCADECLLDNTEIINKRKLLDAIHNGDLKTAKQLIEEGTDVNFIIDCWTPLHTVLSAALNAPLKLKSMDMLELLLSQPSIDVNISDEQLVPPLLWFLEAAYREEFPEEFVLRFIQAECDINISNMNQETPLHLSTLYCTTTVIHELLKRGADVNAQCSRHGTALHCAIRKNNLELVCMLLYYNADIYIKWRNRTPFGYAICLQHYKIIEVLRDYYSFLDDDVNCIIDTGECISLLEYTNNPKLFKAVWPKFDPEIILSRNNPTFIDNYLDWCKYSTSDWVECLYLILNSDIAFDLIEHYNRSNSGRFLYDLQKRMQNRDVQSEDRIGLIYMVLRLGFEIEINNINRAVAIYGLNQNLEPLIYGTYSSITDGTRFVCPLHAFVIGMQTNYSGKKIYQLLHDALEEWNKRYKNNVHCQYQSSRILLGKNDERVLSEIIAMSVPFFSFPADVKNSIMNLNNHRDYIAMVGKELQEIPEFPSLTELSRNQTHKYLVQKFKFKQPYQLQDYVKKLLIPNKIVDIILFREPIY